MSTESVCGPDFSCYIYVVNLVDELPLNMMSREELESIVFTELTNIEKFRFEEETGAVWLTAFIKFYWRESAEIAVRKLNAYDKIGAATISSLFENYRQLENVLKLKSSSFCTFSFIVIEQVNMNLTHDELISLFNTYGSVKIARTSPPMCIGYDSFIEALASKIDQNRWNGDESYVSVKIFPRTKEYILGFLKARSNYSLVYSDQRIFDLGLCVCCCRDLNFQAHRNECDSENISARSSAGVRTCSDSTSQAADNDDEISPTKQCLSFDPNDFIFYLRIESKAFANLDKSSRCNSSSSDTGVSSVASGSTDNSDALHQIHNTGSVQTVDAYGITKSAVEIPFANDPVMHSSASFEQTCPYNPYMDATAQFYPSCSTDTFDPDLQMSRGQDPGLSEQSQHSYSAFEPEIRENYDTQLHAEAGICTNVGPGAWYNYPADARENPEIEKHFELYGMKTRMPRQENDPKIILVPFVYYNCSDELSSKQVFRYRPSKKVTGRHYYAPKVAVSSQESRSFTAEKCSAGVYTNPPDFDDYNYPSLQDSRKCASSLKSHKSFLDINNGNVNCDAREMMVSSGKGRNYKQKRKMPKCVPSHLHIQRAREQSNSDIPAGRENFRYRGSSTRPQSFDKPLQRIKVVFSNRAGSNIRFDRRFSGRRPS